ncbi:MAG: hypothetical protein ACOCUC_01860 [bacterium]
MSLTEEETKAIAAQVVKAMNGQCACGLPPKAQQEMPHLLGMVEDIGDGDTRRGVEVVRDMGKRYRKMSRTSEYISRAIMWLIVVSMFGGVLYVVKKGIISIVKAFK